MTGFFLMNKIGGGLGLLGAGLCGTLAEVEVSFYTIYVLIEVLEWWWWRLGFSFMSNTPHNHHLMFHIVILSFIVYY